MAYVLWQRHLRHNPRDPHWPDRDRFVLSAGHGCALLYSLLHLTGYDLTLDDLKAFRQWGSRTPGPPRVPPDARASRRRPARSARARPTPSAWRSPSASSPHRFNRPGHEIVDHRTFCLVGDGDLMEGISSEAGSLAGHLKLGKLVYLYDDNHVSLDGPDVAELHRGRPARATRPTAGRCCASRTATPTSTGSTARSGRPSARQERPTIIAVRTTIGYGSPHKAGTSAAHGSPLGRRGGRADQEGPGLGVDGRPSTCPPEALEHFRDRRSSGA